MTKKKILLIIGILLILLTATVSSVGAQETPKARAILFYSPNCGHCHEVITTVLQPMMAQYGDSLLILGIDVTVESGSALWGAAMEEIGYPTDQAGVPFMLVDDQVMVGSAQIPDEFPGMVEEALAGEGIPWPDIQVIKDFLAANGYIDANGADATPTPNPDQPTPTTESAVETVEPTQTESPTEALPEPTPTATQVATTVDTTEPEVILLDQNTNLPQNSFIERFNQDPVGNGIAVVVLVWLIGVVVYAAVQFMRAANLKLWPEWVLPVLLIAGLGIAIYLATIEVSGGEAFCGPVGDCNAVQSSEYAKLFGVIPVAILGIIGYVLIGATWLISKKTTGQVQFYTKMGMFLFALVGLLFFVYLTFLEPFVIGATCAWCVSSAIIMSLISLFTLPVMLGAWDKLDLDDEEDEDDEV